MWALLSKAADAVRSSITSQFVECSARLEARPSIRLLKGAGSSTRGGWTAVLGVLLLVVAALGVVVQLRDALNTIFDLEEPEDADAGLRGSQKRMSAMPDTLRDHAEEIVKQARSRKNAARVAQVP